MAPMTEPLSDARLARMCELVNYAAQSEARSAAQELIKARAKLARVREIVEHVDHRYHRLLMAAIMEALNG